VSADAQTRDGGHQHGRAEHGEHVLQSQQRHTRFSQNPRVVNRFQTDFFLLFLFFHSILPPRFIRRPPVSLQDRRAKKIPAQKAGQTKNEKKEPMEVCIARV
jgi:hypothetical protein